MLDSHPVNLAELLEDTPGTLWSHSIIDAMRQAAAPQLARIVVAIDPTATSGEDADETGPPLGSGRANP